MEQLRPTSPLGRSSQPAEPASIYVQLVANCETLFTSAG